MSVQIEAIDLLRPDPLSANRVCFHCHCRLRIVGAQPAYPAVTIEARIVSCAELVGYPFFPQQDAENTEVYEVIAIGKPIS